MNRLKWFLFNLFMKDLKEVNSYIYTDSQSVNIILVFNGDYEYTLHCDTASIKDLKTVKGDTDA